MIWELIGDNMIHLHLHTEYSLLDSIIKIPELVSEVKRRGDKAVAITDHGTLGGWPEFYKECKKEGIKPIFGVEMYHSLTTESKINYHITLLARTKEGFDNIIKLNNLANDNFYKKPRITTDMLCEHGKGIIVLSGCIQGYLAQYAIETGTLDKNFYKRVSVCVDDFYLEIQDTGVPEQTIVRKVFEHDDLTHIVATIDSHYLYKEDAYAHEVSLGIMVNKKITDPKAFKFNAPEYYLKTADEMNFPIRYIKNTNIIADMIEEFDIGFKEWNLPTISVDPKRELSELEFRLDDYLFDSGLNEKEYKDRLRYEFKVIYENGFLPYFKMVEELCSYFDNNKMFRGWGRGSAPGSLVSFLYKITKIDPIKWGLYFERFLNPDRISPPDIDLDFMPEHKAKAIEFFKDKYGEVYQIGNYGTLASKEVINSVSRITGNWTDLADFVPEQAPVPSISELLENNDQFRKAANKEDPIFIDTIVKLNGLKRNFSTHASGIIIGGNVPVRISKTGVNKGLSMTTWDMYALEDLKYVKFDVLGVNNLSVIDKVCKSVGIEVEDIDLNDKKTFKLIQECRTVGVFQWESDGYKRLIKDLHPDTFDELLDLNTLYRPGCLESGLTQQYLDRKFGREPVKQLHPLLNMKTQGLPLYQEDIMNMARVLAGFTLSEADMLRKAIGKKIKKDFEKLQLMWIDGCCANGISDDEAIHLWDMIEKFARYTWNKAHSVAYTLISWWTAYLSANYPVEFLCELLNNADSTDRRRIVFAECRHREVKLLHPDINKSGKEFKIHNDNILIGLSGIKFVGDKTLDSIFEERNNGLFIDAEDLKSRTTVNKRHIEYLTKAGAFGSTSIEDEKEALGYNIGDRYLDTMWWTKYCGCIGEIIDIHTITTKKGDPMCFLKVEYRDKIDSVTVFPQLYAKLKDYFNKGDVYLFSVTNNDNILQFMNKVDIKNLGVHVIDADGFLSFSPSLAGHANIFAGGISISSIDLNNESLKFIEQEFGIEKIVLIKAL